MALMESNQTGQKLKVGDSAPQFYLKGIDGKTCSLDNYRGKKALLVVFMCNHCPYARAKFAAMKALSEDYGSSGVDVVGINSNNNPEFPDDSFDNMVKTAKEEEFNFDYLFDETQQTAKDYGAVCTPDPFLFDGSLKLFYHGRFDDAMDPESQPKTHEMADAINALLEGKMPKHPFLPSRGCSIKWVED